MIELCGDTSQRCAASSTHVHDVFIRGISSNASTAWATRRENALIHAAGVVPKPLIFAFGPPMEGAATAGGTMIQPAMRRVWKPWRTSSWAMRSTTEPRRSVRCSRRRRRRWRSWRRPLGGKKVEEKNRVWKKTFFEICRKTWVWVWEVGPWF